MCSLGKEQQTVANVKGFASTLTWEAHQRRHYQEASFLN